MRDAQRQAAQARGFLWTDENVGKLRDALSLGLKTPAEIGERIGAPASVVAIKLGRGDYERVRASGIHERPAATPPPKLGRPTGGADDIWSGDHVDLLRVLWAKGLSASAISRQIPRTTRSAVLGKVHRLNLPGRKTEARATDLAQGHPRVRTASKERRASHHKPSPEHAWKKATKPARLPSPVPIEDMVAPVSLNVSLMALTSHMCKWPIGDPGAVDFHFCGHPNFNGLPYCVFHSRRAFQPANARQQARADRSVARLA